MQMLYVVGICLLTKLALRKQIFAMYTLIFTYTNRRENTDLS